MNIGEFHIQEKYEKMKHREFIMRQIDNERERQDEMWGEQNHIPSDWIAILVEEIGEVCHAVNEIDSDNYREELIQVAAVALSMIECFDRNKRTMSR